MTFPLQPISFTATSQQPEKTAMRLPLPTNRPFAAPYSHASVQGYFFDYVLGTWPFLIFHRICDYKDDRRVEVDADSPLPHGHRQVLWKCNRPFQRGMGCRKLPSGNNTFDIRSRTFGYTPCRSRAGALHCIVRSLRRGPNSCRIEGAHPTIRSVNLGKDICLL